MLTFEDCIALTDLTEDEIAAIAEHEHLPAIVAAELGNYLVHDSAGCPAIRRMILDDIDSARARGDTRHALALKLVLKHFVETHPDAVSATTGTGA
ncbi:MAG: hypothetical protein RLO51_23155 [Thalassobaculum sp.]|uniref:hypothetical protein n=1 Tax=Thalassobaculum sp. TaxID=2022740 RepID=UPI0032EE8B1B